MDGEAGAQLFQVVLETPDGTRTIECSRTTYVLDAAARSGVLLPSICRQGRCLTCAAKLLAGVVDHADADSYFPQDAAAGYMLPCRARPHSDLRMVTHQEWEMRAHRVALGLPAPYA
jgi:ferredoxin